MFSEVQKILRALAEKRIDWNMIRVRGGARKGGPTCGVERAAVIRSVGPVEVVESFCENIESCLRVGLKERERFLTREGN